MSHIQDILSSAFAAGLITVDAEAVARQALGNKTFMSVFNDDGSGDDILVQAAALLVQLQAEDEPNGYRVHHVNTVECYRSNSGNTTWKAYDQDEEIVYLRQAHKQMLIDAGIWDQLNALGIGTVSDAEITLHTVPDGDFRKVVQIEDGAVIHVPEVDPRQGAIAWASERMKLRDFVVLDTETTSLNGVPIQIAVIDPDGLEIMSTLIRPPDDFPLDAEASAVHGITAEHLVGKPSFPDIAADLRAVLTDKIVIAYNAPFDLKAVSRISRLYDLEVVEAAMRWDCAMSHYAAFAGEILDRSGDFRWHKLNEAAAALGVRAGDQHTAAGDAQTTLAVVAAMAKRSGDIPF